MQNKKNNIQNMPNIQTRFQYMQYALPTLLMIREPEYICSTLMDQVTVLVLPAAESDQLISTDLEDSRSIASETSVSTRSYVP
jgi:hypothetical protein